MCIEMLPNYNHTVIVNFSTVSQYTNEDDNIFITINNELPPLVPIQSPQQDFEYLHLINLRFNVTSNLASKFIRRSQTVKIRNGHFSG